MTNPSESLLFQTTATWRAAYPNAHAGVLALDHVTNPRTHPALEAHKQTLEAKLRDTYGPLDRQQLRALPAFQVYDTYYRQFKKTYHVRLQLESVVYKGKPIPGGAALVEAMFMAELEDLLLTAGHDLEQIEPPVTLDVSRGDETYVQLNGKEAHPKAGDMMMADDQGIISSILYGPDRRSRMTSETTQALFTVYAPPGIFASQVDRHLRRIHDLVSLFSPRVEILTLEIFRAETERNG